MWLITPIGYWLVGVVFQATFLPLWGPKQWRSLCPGDLLLGFAFAVLITVAVTMPEQSGRWWQHTTLHVGVILTAVMIAVAVTALVDAPAMPLSALLSPIKLFHNGVLYAGGVYLVVVTLLALVGSAGWSPRLLLVLVVVVAFVPWVYLANSENYAPDDPRRLAKQEYATPATYSLFWVIPIKGSYGAN